MANGTRLICTGFSQHVIDAEIVSGSHVDAREFIPRLTMLPSDSSLPFDLKRQQFPLRAAFSMTINKSQGQPLDKIGVYLVNPVFTHGRSYTSHFCVLARFTA
jgi:ATP-dependent DNA helicase PIF1